MIKNYFLIATRVIRGNLFFSAIIILGLAVSYAAFHLLWLYADRELQADQFHPKSDKTFRVYYSWRYSDNGETFQEENWGPTLFVCGPWLKNKFEEVEDFTRIVNQTVFRETLVGHDANVYFEYEKPNQQKIAFKEEHVVYADPNIFSFFDVPILKGDKASVLENANSVVLSKAVAAKYFGDEDPVGKILLLNGKQALNVTGVFKNLPSNTHLKFDIVISNVRFARTFTAHDFSGTAHTYIKLNDHVDVSGFADKLHQNDNEFWKPIYLRYAKETATTHLQPIKDVIFENAMAQDNFQSKSRTVLYILKTVAVFILIMGWINYVNLTFSRVMKRVKELATRKTFGAGYLDFLLQFLFETLIINSLAIVLAFFIAWATRDIMETFIQIQLPAVTNISQLVLLYFGIIISGCLVIALYPAFLANAFNINVLFKTNSKSPGLGRMLIRSITVFQYGISIILILWVFIMNLQMNYLLSADTGLSKEQVVVIDGPLTMGDNYATEVASLGNELKSAEGVVDFTSSHSVPGDAEYRMILIKSYGRENNAGLYTNGGIDENFISFYNIRLLKGRNFYKDMPAERNSILLSRVGALRLGWQTPEEAVGQFVILDNWSNPLNEGNKMEVIGVFEDYSLYPFIKPSSESQKQLGSQGLFFTYKNMAIPFLTPNRISVKVAASYNNVLQHAEEKYTNLFAGSFFHWYFLDEHFNKAYKSHLSFKSQVLCFALLAVFIACLGLLGSASFMALEKIKELALRKILGAQPHNLVLVLVRSTGKQLLFSLIVGLPLGYYFVKEYLNDYTLKVSIEWWYFMIPLTILAVIFALTITPILYRSVKINPVTALKNN